MLIFGFAPSLPVALLARALGGLLNGYGELERMSPDMDLTEADVVFHRSNIGVLQTTVAEMVTVKEHQRELHLDSVGSSG